MIRPNSRSAPHFRLAEEASPATYRMLSQLAPAPFTISRRAGMLVRKVAMNSHPKIRPVRVRSTIPAPLPLKLHLPGVLRGVVLTNHRALVSSGCPGAFGPMAGADA